MYDQGFLNLSILYASEYSKSGKNFVTCFLKYKSIRLVCEQIVLVYKKLGIFEDCKKDGKDFTGYANKQVISGKSKEILADILLIIYSIKH